MTYSQDDNSNEDYKNTLRSEFITSLTGTTQEKANSYTEIGYHYLCSAPSSLYKYYSDTPKKLDTVKANKMWYSAPCKFNDVFDCDISIDEKRIFNSILQIIPENRKIRQGSPVWRDLQGQVQRQLRTFKELYANLRETIGISCLSESDTSLLMWAHYANNHRGMCVEYELLEINKQLKFTPIPVIYSDARACFQSLNPDTVKKDSLCIFLQSITSKSPEWRYEKEWRIIRDEAACGNRWEKDKKGALLDMIRPSSITLGCEATTDFEKAVEVYCNTEKINLYKMEKDESIYRLNKKAILEFDS